MGQKHKHRGLPHGQTYADKLAQERMVKQAVEKAAHSQTVRLQTDIRTQRMMWLQILAINRTFKAGPKSFMTYFDDLADIMEEFDALVENHGMQYALEKVRQTAQKITGFPMEYLYESEIREARKRNEARGVFFSVIEEETV